MIPASGSTGEGDEEALKMSAASLRWCFTTGWPQGSCRRERPSQAFRRNRDQLLSEKKEGEGKPKSWEEVMADFDKHHAERNESTLADEIHAILGHRF